MIHRFEPGDHISTSPYIYRNHDILVFFIRKVTVNGKMQNTNKSEKKTILSRKKKTFENTKRGGLIEGRSNAVKYSRCTL